MESGDRFDKRARILEAALTVFGRRGVAKTRIADIASEAGIAYGLVYHYFKNKDEILQTIFEERWARLSERLEEVEKSRGSARERLEGAAQVFIEAYRAHPQVVELLVLEFTGMASVADAAYVQRRRRAYAMVLRTIEQAQSEGEIRPELSAPVLMLMFVGGLQLVLRGLAFELFSPPEQFDSAGAAMIADLFMNGVGTR